MLISNIKGMYFLPNEAFKVPVLFTLLLGLFTLILCYRYFTRNHNFWKKLGIPQTRTLPLIGSTWETFTTTMHELEIKRYKELGKIYGHYDGNKPAISVADPALLKDIFVKDFNTFSIRRDFPDGMDAIMKKMIAMLKGDDWKRVRSIITPTFTTGKIKRMFGIFEECTQTLINNFKNSAATGKATNCKNLFGAFSMDVIASSAFSTKVDSHNDPENKFVLKATNVFSPKITWKYFLFLLMPRVARLLRVRMRGENPMNFFKDVTLQIIEERKRTGKGRNDFLQLMLDTAKEVTEEEKLTEKSQADVTSIYGETEDSQQIFKMTTSKTLSMDELIAQCVIFFLAGYDTTGSTLTFVAYFLAINPDVQEKLRAEVDQAFQETGGNLNHEVVQNMKYLDGVIAETLRLFPAVSRLERTSSSDYVLGDTGIVIPRGTLVSIPNIALHRDPTYFPDPEKFDPDRFRPENRAKQVPYTYLPFGAGPRNCIGMRFALMEMKVCLAYLLRHVKINRCPETKVPIEFYVSTGLINSKSVMVQVEIRNNI